MRHGHKIIPADKYDVIWAMSVFPMDILPIVLDRLNQLHAAGIHGGQARLATLALLPSAPEQEQERDEHQAAAS